MRFMERSTRILLDLQAGTYVFEAVGEERGGKGNRLFVVHEPLL